MLANLLLNEHQENSLAKNKLRSSDRQENKLFSNSITKGKEITGYMRYLGKYSLLFYRKLKSSHYITLSSRKRFMGAEEMAQSVKSLLCRQEDVSSAHWHPCKKPGPVVFASNPSAGQAETGGSLSCWVGSPAKPGSSRFRERPCLTK